MSPEEFLNLHYEAGCKIASRFTIPGYEREDLCQEAALLILKLADHPKAANKGFVAISIKNKFVDMQRRALFLSIESMDAPIDDGEGSVTTLADRIADPRELAIDNLLADELKQQIRSAVDVLPELHQKVVSIHTGMRQPEDTGMSLRKTAALLSISPDKAERTWHKSLEILHSNMSPFMLEAA